MRIILNEPLQIDVAEIAIYFPHFIHRKPFMGTFGYVDSELIRNDRSREKLVVIFFEGRTENGFTEIRSDYENLDALKALLSFLPTPLRNKLFFAFEDATILLRPYSLDETLPWRYYFEKMTDAKLLEQKLNPTLVTEHKGMTSTANTDVKNKKIYLDISQDPLKTALSYAYELKNLENAERYLKIHHAVEQRLIYKSEYVNAILAIEAEAVYFRCQAFRILKLPDHHFPNQKIYLKIYDSVKLLPFEEALEIIAHYIREHSIVKRNYAAKKFYADVFASILGKKSLLSYEKKPVQKPIVLSHPFQMG